MTYKIYAEQILAGIFIGLLLVYLIASAHAGHILTDAEVKGALGL